jgi:aminoglycoside phosphotransferase (APT) family kinase protein
MLMNFDFDIPALEQWMAGAVAGYSGPVRAEKFAGGQSNPTYRINAGDRSYVLRRQPFGTLLPSAHAVDREFRLLSALHPAGFPVPRPFALCEDKGVIGSMFYCMQMVEGRTLWDGTLPDVAPDQRRAYYEAMIDTLADLHALDHAALGLGDFGRPGNYFERQVGRWTKQYRAAQTGDIPEIEKLIDWLSKTVPEQTRTSIIHGDYRIDNIIFAAGQPKVLAVIDWELATLGDPLADFAYFAMNWVTPADGRSGLAGVDLGASGLMTLDQATERYCARTGRDGLPDLHWYFAYNMFRLVSILQGIKKRALEGNASSAQADVMIAKIGPLADAAWEQARMAGASD